VADLSRILGFLDKLKVEYLKSQIETGSAARTKKALQEICKLYRDGFRIRPEQLIGVEQSIVGSLYTQGKDEKVRRWALNALARLGREPTCMEAIMHTLKQYSEEPQTSAAAIAAIYRMSRNASGILKRLSFDEQMVTLAALQHVDANKLDLSSLPLNVETASPDLLRLALVVVGLDRAPGNMLHPRHDNAQLVKVLGGHDDSVVSQYSVWAITENPTLGLRDLGIDIRDIEQQPPNVRAWLFRLIGITAEDAERNIEYIELGTRDPIAETRAGLAVGLKDTYFDGLEALVLDWFTSEHDPGTSEHLLEHMIKQARHCRSYEAMVLEVYEKEPPGSSLRQRMEVGAGGTFLYGKFKQISMVDSTDLFRGVPTVTNNTFNISGGIQAGAVAVGGNAENSGSTQIHYNPQTIEAIQSELSKAERELHGCGIDPALKRQALEQVQAAKVDPVPDKIAKAISILNNVDSVVIKTAGAVSAIGTIGGAVAKLAGFL
jgi:hypothetical protein